MKLKVGQRFSILRDEMPPLKSPNTALVSAWLSCGGELLEGMEYSDTVEALPEGPRRQVTWAVADTTVLFGTEEVDFQEFRRRWLDADWCNANRNHPIAHLRDFVRTNNELRDAIKQRKPSALVRNGIRTAVIPPDCSEEMKDRILRGLHE